MNVEIPKGFTGKRIGTVAEYTVGDRRIVIAHYEFTVGKDTHAEPYVELDRTDGTPAKLAAISTVVDLFHCLTESEVWELCGREGASS